MSISPGPIDTLGRPIDGYKVQQDELFAGDFPTLAELLKLHKTSCLCDGCRRDKPRELYYQCYLVLKGKKPLRSTFISSLPENIKIEFVKLLCLRAVGAKL